MGDLRNLNRAVQYITSPSHEFTEAVREWIAEATERMEPKQWQCKRCKASLGDGESHLSGGVFTCHLPEKERLRPAAPSKMPEATLCRGCGQNHDGVRCEDPAPAIRMTEELEMVLRSAALAATREAPMEAAIVRSSIAAVRAQAQAAEAVKLPKVREAIDILGRLAYGEPFGDKHLKRAENAALAELDAVESNNKGDL